jgi:phosphatidylethanolamine-binding protein (PEBP) family uncharacterized protein
MKTAACILLALTVGVLCGCGSGSATSTSGSASPASVSFTSSAVHGRTLPALYTCDGSDISPPLSWGPISSPVEELVLFVIGTRTERGGQPVAGIDWAMGGVSPRLRHLSAGEVPPGAFVLANATGRRRYAVCPTRGQTEIYTFALLALPRIARASPKISSNVLLYNLTASPQRQDRSPVSGTFAAGYTRR